MAPTARDGTGEFAGQVAIVTGAAGGIGRATALRLAGRGAAVIVADRREEVAETASAVEAAGGTALHRIVDVTDDEQVRGLVGAALERFGRLDVMVNNAGSVGRPAALTEMDPEAFDRTLAINARGTFLGMKHALAPMLERRSGAIVNVSSITAVTALPGLGAYAASKHAVIGLTRVGAVEGAAAGVRVNAVLPGPTATRMIGAEDFSGRVPLGRAADPAEPAAAICFLASEAASFITGESILVDGGMAYAEQGLETAGPR